MASNTIKIFIDERYEAPRSKEQCHKELCKKEECSYLQRQQNIDGLLVPMVSYRQEPREISIGVRSSNDVHLVGKARLLRGENEGQSATDLATRNLYRVPLVFNTSPLSSGLSKSEASPNL